MNSIRRCWLLLCFIVFFAVDRSAAQTDATWNGGDGGWNSVSNWSGGVIPSGVEYNTFIDGGNSVSSTVRIDGGQAIDVGSITISTGDSLVIDEQSTIGISPDVADINPNSGKILNNGRIEIGLSSGGTIRLDSSTTLSGGGVIDLMKSESSISLVGSATSITSFTNVDNTIQGVGEIKGAGDFQFVNGPDGVIDANVANGQLGLYGDQVSIDFVNRGVLQATNGGTLEIGRIEASDYDRVAGIDNAGGAIVAGEGSTVALGYASIAGGTLRSEGNGVIETGRGVYLYGNVDVEGRIRNVGTINLLNPLTGEPGELTITAAVTLSGDRIVNLSGGTIGGVSGGQSVLTNVDNMIRARGARIGNGDLTFINGPDGFVRTYGSLQSNPFVIDATVLNEGEIEVYYNDYLELFGLVTNTASGIITGEGTITTEEAIVNEGRISPGVHENHVGELLINGSLQFTDSGALVIDIEDGGADLLSVFQGDVSLDGDLLIDLTYGFLPDSSDAFDILKVIPTLAGQGPGSLSGTFTGIDHGDRALTRDERGSFVVNYDYDGGRVWLSNFVSVPEPGSLVLLGALALVRSVRRRRAT